MKSIFLMLLFFSMWGFASAQEINLIIDADGNLIGKDTIPTIEVKQEKKSPAEICKERGHIPGNTGWMTGLYIHSYLIETDSTTIRVTPPGNWFTTSCERCGVEITEQEPEIREIIWRRKKE